MPNVRSRVVAERLVRVPVAVEAVLDGDEDVAVLGREVAELLGRVRLREVGQERHDGRGREYHRHRRRRARRCRHPRRGRWMRWFRVVLPLARQLVLPVLRLERRRDDRDADRRRRRNHIRRQRMDGVGVRYAAARRGRLLRLLSLLRLGDGLLLLVLVQQLQLRLEMLLQRLDLRREQAMLLDDAGGEEWQPVVVVIGIMDIPLLLLLLLLGRCRRQGIERFDMRQSRQQLLNQHLLPRRSAVCQDAVIEIAQVVVGMVVVVARGVHDNAADAVRRRDVMMMLMLMVMMLLAVRAACRGDGGG